MPRKLDAAAPADDLVLPFQVDELGVRGRLVRLGAVAQTILGRHDYPDEVRGLVGEALALTATLGSALKFDGIFTLQTKGNGAVPMMVVDYRSPGAPGAPANQKRAATDALDASGVQTSKPPGAPANQKRTPPPPGTLRGYASVDAAKLAALGPAGAGQRSVLQLLGAGHLAFTIDQGEHTERVQGLVELTGPTLADCAHRYLRQSEQIAAGIRLAAGRGGDGTGTDWRAGGLMLQRMPAAGGVQPSRPLDKEDDDDAWPEALALLGSLRDAELIGPSVAPFDLLGRLFRHRGVRVWAARPLHVGCTCSRQRVYNVLRSFPAAELSGMVIDGQILVTCEFCRATYEFDAALATAPERS